MKDLIKIQQKLVPEIVEKMYRRFSILTTISKYQPVGRRSLSEYMDLTERVLRSETDALKKQELVKVKPTGMEITDEGEATIRQLNSYFNSYSDDHHLAQVIKDAYDIKDVYVIPEILIQIRQLRLNYRDRQVNLLKMFSMNKRLLPLRVGQLWLM